MSTFGLIGSGYWGKIVSSEIQKTGNYLLWTYDLLGNYPIPVSQVDFIYLATPASVRLEPLEQFFHLSSNFIIAKPLAISSSILDRLSTIALDRSLNIYCDHNFFYCSESTDISHVLRNNYPYQYLNFSISRCSNGVLKPDCTIFDDLFIHEFAQYEAFRLALDLDIESFWDPSSHSFTYSDFIFTHHASLFLNDCNVNLTTSLNWLSPFKKRDLEINSNNMSLIWSTQAFPNSMSILTGFRTLFNGRTLSLSKNDLFPSKTYSSSLSSLFMNDCALLKLQMKTYTLSYFCQLYKFYFSLQTKFTELLHD